jgi:hypothetical protein
MDHEVKVINYVVVGSLCTNRYAQRNRSVLAKHSKSRHFQSVMPVLFEKMTNTYDNNVCLQHNKSKPHHG